VDAKKSGFGKLRWIEALFEGGIARRRTISGQVSVVFR